MRNRRICQQPLRVGLGERGEVGAGHGGNRHKHQHRRIDGPQRKQSQQQDSDQHRPRRRLHRHRHEPRHASRSAFVRVRRPLVERDGGNLEHQAHHGCKQRDDQHGIVRIHPPHRIPDDSQVRAARQSVKQRQSVGKDARRKRSQQQVLQRRFIRPAVAPQKSDQDVRGNRHQLQADEDQHNIEPGSHAHHADYRKQHQRIELAMMLVLDFEVPHRHDDGNRRPHQKQIEEIDGDAVHQHRVHQSQLIKAPAPAADQVRLDAAYADRRKHHSHQRGHRVHPLPLRRQHQVNHQDAERKNGQLQHREHEQVVHPAEILGQVVHREFPSLRITISGSSAALAGTACAFTAAFGFG